MNLKRLILFVALAAGIVACERGRPEALKRTESGGFAVQEAKDQISALGYMAGGAPKSAWIAGENVFCFEFSKMRPGDTGDDNAYAAAVVRLQLP